MFPPVTTLTTCFIHQRRSHSRDLFTLPHRCLHKEERITAVTAIKGRPYYHLVATHRTVLLVDERMSNTPVSTDFLFSNLQMVMEFCKTSKQNLKIS